MAQKADFEPEMRLQRALATTSAVEPRPLTPIDLPADAAHLLDDRVLARLVPAAVLVPVLPRPAGAAILLTVRADTLRNHAGQISFPGGRRDPEDAGVIANAMREANEEVGLQAGDIEVIGCLDDYPTVTGFRVTPVVGLVDPAAAVAADDFEVVDVFEVPLSLVLDPASYRREWLERDGIRLPFYALPYGDRYIWGATAAMLFELAQRVRAEP